MRPRALALLSTLLCSVAQADATHVVSVEAPPDARCLDSAGLAKLVDERLGSSASARAQGPVRVEITHVDGGYAAIVRDDPDGARLRTLESRGVDCHDLDEVLVMVVATAIGFAPRAASESPSSAPGPAPAPPAARVLARADTGAPEPPPARRLWWRSSELVGPPVRVRWAAHGAAASGLLPRWALGPALGASWLHAGSGPLLGARVLIAPAAPLGEQAYAQGAAALLGGGYCVGLSGAGRLSVSLCASGQLGAITLRTSGLARSARVWAELVQAELGLRAQLVPRGGSVGLSAAASALLPVWAPAFSLRDERGASQRYHSVSPGLLVEVGLTFGGGS